jgi:hypothetical protein
VVAAGVVLSGVEDALGGVVEGNEDEAVAPPVLDVGWVTELGPEYVDGTLGAAEGADVGPPCVTGAVLGDEVGRSLIVVVVAPAA